MDTIFHFNLEALERMTERAVERAIEKSAFTQQPPTPELMNFKAAAEFLGIAEATLYKFTSERRIPHYKRGKKLYFFRSELEAWIAEGKVKTQAEIQAETLAQLGQEKKGGQA